MVLLKAHAGLCNKLLAMAAGLHYCRDVGTQLHVLWATDSHMANLFTELFEPTDAFTLHQMKIPANRICHALANRILPRFFNEKDEFLVREKAFLESCKKHPNRFWRFSSFREFYPADDFSWLKPRPEIAARIAEFAHLVQGETIGLHIRRGDHIQAMRCSPLQLFYDRVAAEVSANTHVRIFLCTDDPEVKRDLVRRYPRNIVTRESVLARHDKGGVADGIVDLWLLSKCRKIYGTYPSSFSLVASKIGKTEFEWIRDEREPA